MVKIRINSVLKAIAFVVAAELAGNIGTIFTVGAIPTWYATLIKPSFTPPNWVFGPVWTILFALMGVSAYIVYSSRADRKRVRTALYVFVAQFVLNVLWSVLFFGLRSPLYGLIDIITMWIAIAITISLFFRISKKAGAMLLPYIIWVSIAAALNISVFLLN